MWDARALSDARKVRLENQVRFVWWQHRWGISGTTLIVSNVNFPLMAFRIAVKIFTNL